MPKNRRRSRKAPRRKGRAPGSASHLVEATQELMQLTLGTPSGTFVGGQIPLIPTFEPTSRLGVIALLYSQYTIERSTVSFVSQTSTTTSGRLCLSWTFDALDADPVNMHQILQNSHMSTGVVFRNRTTTMPRNSPEKRRYAVIDGPSFTALSSPDKQIYLPATLVWGTDGSAQSGLLVGSLIWRFRIRFHNPQVPTGVVNFRTILDANDDTDNSEDESFPSQFGAGSSAIQ
jgi:hypothetical protein